MKKQENNGLIWWEEASNFDKEKWEAMQKKLKEVPEEEFWKAYLADPNEVFDKRECRECGCTDENCMYCIETTGGPCHWVEEDLCSACALKAAHATFSRSERILQELIDNLYPLQEQEFYNSKTNL